MGDSWTGYMGDSSDWVGRSDWNEVAGHGLDVAKVGAYEGDQRASVVALAKPDVVTGERLAQVDGATPWQMKDSFLADEEDLVVRWIVELLKTVRVRTS